MILVFAKFRRSLRTEDCPFVSLSNCGVGHSEFYSFNTSIMTPIFQNVILMLLLPYLNRERSYTDGRVRNG